MKALLAIMVFIASLGLVYFVARPMWENISSLRLESGELADNLARLNEVKSLRDDLINKNNSISKDDHDKLFSILPATPQTEELQASIESLTKSRGIRMKSIGFTTPPTSNIAATQSNMPSVSTASYNMNISSTYDAFKSLLGAFESNLRLTDISNISFSSPPFSSSYDFSLQAKSYFQKRQ